MKIEKLNNISASRYNKIINRCQEKIYPLVLHPAGQVVEDIRKNGNKALIKYIKKYEKIIFKPQQLLVNAAEIKNAYRNIAPGLLESIKLMIENVTAFYKCQLKNTNMGWQKAFKDGYIAGQLLKPLEAIGVYVPGGMAVYPSTAVMGVVPARIAGVKKIVIATPAGRKKRISAAVLVAAHLAGADVILKAGGMQAIGAMASGTETVPRVDKIIGPGNIWVSAAKLYVMIKNYAAIDFIAGPSELMIIADGNADSRFIARDMLAQSEHDPNSAAVLITISVKIAKEVQGLLKNMSAQSPRRKTIEASLGGYGAILVADNIGQAVSFADKYAPEHLQLMTASPEKILKSVNNAGSIFLGEYTPVALGDYMSGTNHILPTGNSARYTCGVNLETFLRRPTFQAFTKRALNKMKAPLIKLSEAEGLPEHGNSVKERFF